LTQLVVKYGLILLSTQNKGFFSTTNGSVTYGDEIEDVLPSAMNILALDDRDYNTIVNKQSVWYSSILVLCRTLRCQNVNMVCVRKISIAKRHKIARHWLNEVGLSNLEHSYLPDELSGVVCSSA
jgi:glycine betaine/proline transport system ATP-binding protein